MVSTPCPAIVSYVQKYMPRLRGALAHVVSPMIATARAIRGQVRRRGPHRFHRALHREEGGDQGPLRAGHR